MSVGSLVGVPNPYVEDSSCTSDGCLRPTASRIICSTVLDSVKVIGNRQRCGLTTQKPDFLALRYGHQSLTANRKFSRCPLRCRLGRKAASLESEFVGTRTCSTFSGTCR